jgi:hypothetical protein
MVAENLLNPVENKLNKPKRDRRGENIYDKFKLLDTDKNEYDYYRKRVLVILSDGTSYIGRYTNIKIVSDFVYLSFDNKNPDVFASRLIVALITLQAASDVYSNIINGNITSLIKKKTTPSMKSNDEAKDNEKI